MNCGTCRYFAPATAVNLEPNAAAGSCRRYPPLAMLVPARNAQGFVTASDHPPVKRSAWCGEYAPKIADLNAEGDRLRAENAKLREAKLGEPR